LIASSKLNWLIILISLELLDHLHLSWTGRSSWSLTNCLIIVVSLELLHNLHLPSIPWSHSNLLNELIILISVELMDWLDFCSAGWSFLIFLSLAGHVHLSSARWWPLSLFN
jgi:hypothetical protein